MYAPPAPTQGSPEFDLGAVGASYILRAIDIEEKLIPDKLRNCSSPDDRILLQGEARAYSNLRQTLTSMYREELNHIRELSGRAPYTER